MLYDILIELGTRNMAIKLIKSLLNWIYDEVRMQIFDSSPVNYGLNTEWSFFSVILGFLHGQNTFLKTLRHSTYTPVIHWILAKVLTNTIWLQYFFIENFHIHLIIPW
jgi:hypothetical protein